MSKPVFDDMFSLGGRRNRKSFFLYSLAVIAILCVVWIVAVAGDNVGFVIVAGLLTVAILISAVIVQAQRCRDFGWTGWAVLIVLIPVVGALFQIALWFIPGTDGTNRYGSDPVGK